MKKITLFAVFILTIVLSNIIVNGQVTYEQTYLTRATGLGQDFFLTNLGNDNYKYVIYDYRYSTFSLYNLNHTPFMLNIQIPVANDSVNSFFYRIGYITSTLFDCDSSNIEYAMMSDHPSASHHPNFAVYRTDGSLIFSKDTVGTIFCVGCGSGSWEMHPIMNTPAGAKLFLFNYEINDYTQNFVYSLCGSVPETIVELNQTDSYVKVFPNPSSKQMNFQITAPSHSEKYELTILNSAFQVIKTTEITGGETLLNMDNESLSSGVYYYSFQNKNKIFQTGKFVLSK